MPQCPGCQKEIKHLNTEVIMVQRGKLDNGGGFPCEEGPDSENRQELYRCPECFEIIFVKFSDACLWLNGQPYPEFEKKICPSGDHEITEIGSYKQVWIVYRGGEWVQEVKEAENEMLGLMCPECFEELDAKDLDKLGVPNEVR
jgi:hypothetical protein